MHPPWPHSSSWRGRASLEKESGCGCAGPSLHQYLPQKQAFCFLGSHSHLQARLRPSWFIAAVYFYPGSFATLVLENTDIYTYNNSAAKIHTSSLLQDFPLKAGILGEPAPVSRQGFGARSRGPGLCAGQSHGHWVHHRKVGKLYLLASGCGEPLYL